MDELLKLFQNAGQKIRGYAIMLFFVNLCLTALCALATFGAAVLSEEIGMIFLGVVGAAIEFVIGLFGAYIFSLFLVAFGDLVQDTADNKAINAQLLAQQTGSPSAAPAAPAATTVTRNAQVTSRPINPDDYAVGTTPPPPPAPAPLPNMWVCSHCGTQNSNNYSMCKKCGQYRS